MPASLATALTGDLPRSRRGSAGLLAPSAPNANTAFAIAQYGLPAIPAAPYASLDVDDWDLRRSDAPTAAEEIGAWPELLALALDPRATGIAARDTAVGVTMRIAVDASQPLAGPVYPQTVDPGSPVGLAVLLPHAPAPVRLWERRGSAAVLLPTKVERASGLGGAVLVDVGMPGEGLQLAYGLSYRLALGATSLSFQAPALPASYLARSWTFTASMTPAARRAWLAAVAGAPPVARRILSEVDGAVTVSLRNCGAEAGDSCASVSDVGRYSVWLSPADRGDSDGGRFVVLHELGHVVDYLGLDRTGYAAFRALFQRSPAWRACFPDPDSGCVPFAEVFADQFTYYATGERNDPTGGYGDPPLATRAAFERVLVAEYAFRPPWARNPARR